MAAPNHSGKEIDVVVYGASGYTGRLVAEYLNKTYGDSIRWAMAGRNKEKLEAVRDEIGAPASVPIIIADGGDPASLDEMCRAAKVVLTTVGPYQIYGSDLVRACAETGTDYVDLCGEPNWMREMIDRYGEQAKASGARIVFSCGFDSIPFDIGVQFIQAHATKKFGKPSAAVRTVVTKMKGTFSGGTAASLKATMTEAFKDPNLIALLKNPFALAPEFNGPKQPSGSKPKYDEELDTWLAPFVMAPINTKNIHRSNFLLGHAYGEEFTYNEMFMTGPGEKGEAMAKAVASDNSITSDDAPKPGEGPTKEERETGYYEALLIAKSASGEEIRATVSGDRDPGYGSTSKMIAESALCLVLDSTETPGGIWTPASALGAPLLARLEAKAGLAFKIVA